MTKIYEIAQNQAEAEDLCRHGFGYETKKEAERALRSPEIDPYYRGLLRVFELDRPSDS